MSTHDCCSNFGALPAPLKKGLNCVLESQNVKTFCKCPNMCKNMYISLPSKWSQGFYLYHSDMGIKLTLCTFPAKKYCTWVNISLHAHGKLKKKSKDPTSPLISMYSYFSLH